MIKIGNGGFWAAFVAVMIALGSIARADVKVQAFADRKQMGLGDTIDVTVQVSSSESVEVGEPEVPDLKDFQLVNAWTSSSTSSKLVQGDRGMEFQTQKMVEFHYMLTPQKQGRLVVPAFEVSVDGKKMKTNSVAIEVSGQGSGAARPQRPGMPQGMDEADPMDEAEAMFNQLLQRQMGRQIPKGNVVPKNPNEAFFIHLELDKTEVYEGEQITANWYLYTRGNILALDRLKFPDLKGFWKEIIEEVPALNFTQEILNGVPYRKALLASHALFPIKPGIAVVDEYKVKATVQVPTNPMGVFGFGQPYSYQRSSDRVKITVKPLPVQGKPNDFSGAVGQFDVQASVDHNEVPINQPLSFKLRFEGEGNAKLIELPPLNLPPGIENYDTKSDAKFFKNGRSFKEFEVLLIPREPGEVTLPAVSVSAFDPRTGQYYTKKTEPITLKVTGEKTNEAASATTGADGKAAAKATPAAPTGPQLPPVLTEYQSTAMAAASPMALGVASVLALLGLGWKARRELGSKERKATLREVLHRRVKKVDKILKGGEGRKAATEMTNVIYSVLGAISGEGGASREISHLLDKAPPSLRRELGEELAKTLDEFQLLSFAPEEAVGEQLKPASLAPKIAQTEKLLVRAIGHLDS